MTRNAHAPESSAKTWRQRLQTEQAVLKARFAEDANTSRLLKQHSKLVDILLQDLWRVATISKDVCLVAVGGYGRGELFPYSDVDLLILLPEQASAEVNQSIESLIGLFWDIGLAVGHSVRTLSECGEEAAKDATVQTNLLEARYLTGDRQLYRQFEALLGNLITPADFFQAKMQEQRLRHARFNDTAYNLEPNIKESPGGLRDLQNVLWIARSLGLGHDWSSLVKHGLITQSEARQIRRHERHLQMLRTRLHYLASRREDRLIFDFQNDLAKSLGFTNTPRRRASEQLMYGFYNSAKFISLMNDILLQLLEQRISPAQAPATPINDRFEARHGLLDIKSTIILQREPSAILESFLLLETHQELKGMSPSLLRTLHRVKNLVNREFRQSRKNKDLFIQILQAPIGVTHTFRLMNRYGILGRYIPAFGRIVGQMQHDLFHVYTVDEHILNVLRNLRRFALSKFDHEFPLCSRLFAAFDAPHLLYLAALFHDIAKGRNGDHSTLGAVDARKFCRQHGLPKADCELVAWLVDSHLTMSKVAQKSDLSDPAVIEQFAQLMGNERRLTALYLLTVADIRGTSPKVWNAWKAKLLENLFFATQRSLRGDSTDAQMEIELRQAQARERLSYYGISQDSYRDLWQKLGKQYFLRYEGQEIAWHTRMLIAHSDTPDVIVRARLSPAGDGIQTMIYTLDRNDLFALICSFFERCSYNIVEARIHTTLHSYALNSFIVLDHNDRSVSYRDLLNYIEYELTQKLSEKNAALAPVNGRVSRQVKHMPISSSISIQADSHSNNHTIDIVANDRPGLLSKLASMFLKHQVHLHSAKINTLGNRAEDMFVVSGPKGSKLEEHTLRKLEEDLLNEL
ncbi:MAG: [protein-PII] uridylyltransferase [Betaproteobacteria bacterium HGW-Betaproteobacteria-8]|nr:MAG: [protein-PII] uridylyltransferase [Betaproteobacteria bacterium HGW-Betaproteobacteria-8]